MKINIIILAAITLLSVSCSLDEKMRSASLPEDYYQTELQCRTALNSCYQKVRAPFVSKNYFQICEVQTDLMYSNRASEYNAILQVSPSNPQYGSTMWTDNYIGVMRANAAYAGISRSPLSEEEKAPLLAEAVVLRAMFYYLLTCNFGDVPYYTEEVTSESNMRISKLPRMSAYDIRDSLINDLNTWIVEKKALDWKPTNSDENRQQYRCGAALGLYLAGKFCLWNERWTEAVEYFGYLEEIYGNGAGMPEGALAKYPLSDIPFSRRNTPEVILEVSNISVEYGLQLYGNLASYTTPIRANTVYSEEDEDPEFMEEADNDLYDGVGIPELGKYARTHVPIRPTRKVWKKLMPWDSPDKRRSAYEITATNASTPGEIIKIEDGGGYLAWGWPGYTPEDDRSQTEPMFRLFAQVKGRSYRPFLGNKFWCFGMQYTMDNNSYKVFRFAGVILGLAEAWCQKGNLEMACAYLNAVKTRAGIALVAPADFSTKRDLMEEIQNEYGRELLGEFQRKHDLVRWGIWYDSVMEYNVSPSYNDNYDGGENNTRLAKNIKPCHEYYPIPDEQITYSGGALDNKEYNKYGL